MPVEFSFDFEKARAALVYLANKRLPKFDKYRACKLLFLADKQHLVRYGRVITGDRYKALEHGPAPDAVLTLLGSFERNERSNPQVAELVQVLDIDRNYRYPRYIAKAGANLELLSQSDCSVLDEIADAYGQKTFEELKGLTHEMVAYKLAWENRRGESALMKFEDFFEEDEDAVEGAYEEMVENHELRMAFPAPDWF